MTLNWWDAIKGLLVAVIGAILTVVLQTLQNGGLLWTWAFWQPILFTGLTAGIAYILKNFFQNSEGKPTAEPK